MVMSSPGSGGSPFDFLARFAGPIAWLIAGLLLLFGGLCLGCHWSFTMCGGIFCVGRPLVGWMWLWGKVFFLFNDIECFLHSMDLTLNLFYSSKKPIRSHNLAKDRRCGHSKVGIPR